MAAKSAIGAPTPPASESSLTEDTDVCSLVDDDFRRLMDQLVDFKRPEKDKSPLVRKLNVDASKDESCLDTRCDRNLRHLQELSSETSSPHPNTHSYNRNHLHVSSVSSTSTTTTATGDGRHVSSSLRTYSNNPSNNSSSANHSSNHPSTPFMGDNHNNNIISNICHSQCISDNNNIVEMHDMRKKGEVMTYKSATHMDNVHYLESLPRSEEPTNMFDEAIESAGLNSIDRRDSRNNNNLFQNDSLPSSGRPSSTLKSNSKKKRKEEPKIFAENIEGFVGNKEVEELVIYINGEESKKNGRKSDPKPEGKKDSGKKKSSSVNNNSGSNSHQRQRCSSAESLKRQKTPSPSPVEVNTSHATSTSAAASYVADDFTSSRQEEEDLFSDDEKGYHTDQESGFQVMRTKKRYNRHRPKMRGQAGIGKHTLQSSCTGSAMLPSPVTSSSLSTSFSVTDSSTSAADSAALTSRGYESEKEFYTKNERTFHSRDVKRKVASSLPHSERNSPENSDVDSSLSLPFVHRVSAILPPAAGVVTYASKVASSAPPSSTLTNASTCICINAASSTLTLPPVVIADSESYPPISSTVESNCASSGHISKISAPGGQEHAITHPSEEDTAKSAYIHDSLSLTSPSLTMASSSISPTPSILSSQASSTNTSITTKSVVIGERGRSSSSASNSTELTNSDQQPSNFSLQHQQLRKQNSVPGPVLMKRQSMAGTKSLNRSLDLAKPLPSSATTSTVASTPTVNCDSLPPVIMCEDRVGVRSSLPSTSNSSVTFGFFDDLPICSSIPAVLLTSDPHSTQPQQNSSSSPNDRKLDDTTKITQEKSPISAVYTTAASVSISSSSSSSSPPFSTEASTSSYCTSHESSPDNENGATEQRQQQHEESSTGAQRKQLHQQTPQNRQTNCVSDITSNPHAPKVNSSAQNIKSNQQKWDSYRKGVDWRSFNYSELLAYIQDAWEGVARLQQATTMDVKSLSSSGSAEWV